MSKILDSGARREFDSGAVRDVQIGKGRCDLLPLDVVSTFIGMCRSNGHVRFPMDDVLEFIHQYVVNGDVGNLYTVIKKFIDMEGIDPYTAILELAKHYEEGSLKYQERNWEKGIPLHCYIDSGVRHYLKHIRGDKDEPHDRAFLWNMFGAIWTHNHKPELIDLPFKEKMITHEKVSEIRDKMKVHRETSFA